MGRLLIFAGILYVAGGLSVTGAAEMKIGPEARTSLDVTLYGGGFAAISEKRSVPVQKGLNNFSIGGVANQINSDTVRISAKNLQIREFSYDQRALNARTLLKDYRGKEVFIETSHPQTGEIKRQKAKILDTGSAPILEMGGLIYTTPPGRLVFPGLPEGLRLQRSLTLRATAEETGASELDLSYLSGGFGWRANYVALLNDNGTALELNGRATVINQSGMDLTNATLTLIAGQVNAPQQNERLPMQSEPRAMKTMAMAADSVRESIPSQSFGERHLYSLPGKLTLRHGESKQVTLFVAPTVKAERRFVFQSGIRGGVERRLEEKKARLKVRFINRKSDGLNLPLPRGPVNTYQKDKNGILRYVGQSSLDDIAVGKTAEVDLGRAFDVSLKRTQTAFRHLGPKNRNFESEWKLELSNGKAEAVNATLEENMFGDWQIVESSHEIRSKTAQKAVWRVKVPAKGKTTVTYRVAVQNK